MKDIKLEKDVVSSDGEVVGSVDRIIVHPKSLEVEGIVVHEGILFTTDRIVEEEFIDRVDADGTIYLNVSKDEEERLPELVKARFVEADAGVQSQVAEMEHMTMPSAHGQVLVMSERADPDFAPAPDSPLQPAPSDPPNIVDRTNLPEGTVMLEEGTDVLDINGEKIGTIDEVVYDANDQITEIIIGEGMLFTEHVRVPADWIESVTSDIVVISKTAEHAEKAGKTS